jgi:hypothetical protein
MRAIKVTYRAVFQQPTGPELNPMGLKLPGPFPVELFPRGEYWQARELASPKRVVYDKLGKFVSLAAAKLALHEVFEKQVQDWQIWGMAPGNGVSALSVERMLTPYDIADLGEGRLGWVDDEDRTHILHGPLIDPKFKIPNAACGAQVNAKCFISTKANVEPSCRGCKEVWEREYQNR